MWESFSNNIIALIFLSYAIGSVLHTVFDKYKWYHKYYSLQFLSDALSKKLRLPAIGQFIVNSIFGKFNPHLTYKGKADIEKLKNLHKVMIGAELGHLIAFIFLVIVCIIYIVIQKNWMITLGLFVANIFLNLFLVFIQQYNKRRVKRILDRMEYRS